MLDFDILGLQLLHSFFFLAQGSSVSKGLQLSPSAGSEFLVSTDECRGEE